MIKRKTFCTLGPWLLAENLDHWPFLLCPAAQVLQCPEKREERHWADPSSMRTQLSCVRRRQSAEREGEIVHGHRCTTSETDCASQTSWTRFPSAPQTVKYKHTQPRCNVFVTAVLTVSSQQWWLILCPYGVKQWFKMMQSISPPVCLFVPCPSSRMELWLLYNTNRKPYAWSQTHWSAWQRHTDTRSG